MSWIKINEERSNLPEPCSAVLITYVDSATAKWTETAYFDGDSHFYFEGISYAIDSKVTHWQYLPKPAID
jgi:hypothetical protein